MGIITSNQTWKIKQYSHLKMKNIIPLSILASFFIRLTDAYVPQVTPKSKLPALNAKRTSVDDFKKAAMATFAAATIASNVFTPMSSEAATTMMSPFESSSTTISEKVTRSGLYKDYEVDIEQQVDDARSTFKGKGETKKKKGKYTALLGVLVFGSFVIPMAQYFWYVRDDDSADRFFNKVPEPEPEPEKPKKKGWFS